MSKDQIANEHVEMMKAMHGEKLYADDRTIAITGASFADSIGAEIINYISVMNYINKSKATVINLGNNIDVRTAEIDFRNCTDLVMCHGVTHMNWIEKLSPEHIKEIVDVNLTGSIFAVQQFVQQTLDSPYRKKIISIGSMAYKSVLNASSAYCASKAGLAHFMKCAAWELTPKGYDVYSVHPSNVQDTPMTRDTISGIMNVRKIDDREAKQYWGANNPREEFLTKKEIGQTVSMLLFDDKGYMSGSNIELAGGQR